MWWPQSGHQKHYWRVCLHSPDLTSPAPKLFDVCERPTVTVCPFKAPTITYFNGRYDLKIFLNIVTSNVAFLKSHMCTHRQTRVHRVTWILLISRWGVCSEGLVQDKNLVLVPSWPLQTHTHTHTHWWAKGLWPVISETVGVFAALSSPVFSYHNNIQSPASSWPLTSATEPGIEGDRVHTNVG